MLNLAIGILAGQITLLLVMRPILLWYLKINRAVKALESIDQSLKCLPAVRIATYKAGKSRSRAA